MPGCKFGGGADVHNLDAIHVQHCAQAGSFDGLGHSSLYLGRAAFGKKGFGYWRNKWLLLLVDDLPCPDRVAHLCEVAEINRGIGVEDHEIGGVTIYDLAGLASLEEGCGIGGERGENVAKVHSGAAHVFVLAGGVVELGVAHVGAEEDGAALVEVTLELRDRRFQNSVLLQCAAACLAHFVGEHRQRWYKRHML